MDDVTGFDAAAGFEDIYEIRERADGSGLYEVYDKKAGHVASGWAIKTRDQAEKWITDEARYQAAQAAAAKKAEVAWAKAEIALAKPAARRRIAAVKKVAIERLYWEEGDDGDASFNGGFGYVTVGSSGRRFEAGWETGGLVGEKSFTDLEEAAEWVEAAFNDPEGREDGSYS